VISSPPSRWRGGLVDELKAAKGSVVQCNVDCGLPGSIRSPGTAYSTSERALAALTREMAAISGPARHSGQCHRAGETTPHLSPAREDRRADSPASPGHARRGRKIIYVLCTDTSSYVNGAEIHINGGQHV